MHRQYPHGVGRLGAVDQVRGPTEAGDALASGPTTSTPRTPRATLTTTASRVKRIRRSARDGRGGGDGGGRRGADVAGGKRGDEIRSGSERARKRSSRDAGTGGTTPLRWQPGAMGRRRPRPVRRNLLPSPPRRSPPPSLTIAVPIERPTSSRRCHASPQPATQAPAHSGMEYLPPITCSHSPHFLHRHTMHPVGGVSPGATVRWIPLCVGWD